MEENKRKCRFCGRILVKKSPLRICPACFNKGGTVVATGAAAAATYIGYTALTIVKKRFDK